MKRNNAHDGTQSVRRALSILDHFAVGQPSLTVPQISNQTGLAVPSVYRLLKALQAKHLLVYDPVSRRYSLGSEILRLAGVIMQREDVQAIAMPHLQLLRELTGETVGLHWLVGYQRVCVVELVSAHPIRMASGVGQAYPLHAGASGKAMLAWFSRGDLERFITDGGLPALTAKTIRTKEEFFIELARIREQGFATSFGESVVGASAFAAPVLNSSGQPLAAVNITGPEDRWTLTRMMQSVDALLEKTAQIMSQLGATRFQMQGRGKRNREMKRQKNGHGVRAKEK
jgi:DNA-binding IclR family transcriptional regulator